MATTETPDQQIAPEARAVDPTDLETIVSSYVTGLVIIGLAVSFLVVVIGFVADQLAVMIAGSFALSAVTLVWATAVALGLWKSVKIWWANRRTDTSESTDAELSR